jgi:hypothetical protein
VNQRSRPLDESQFSTDATRPAGWHWLKFDKVKLEVRWNVVELSASANRKATFHSMTDRKGWEGQLGMMVHKGDHGRQRCRSRGLPAIQCFLTDAVNVRQFRKRLPRWLKQVIPGRNQAA